MNKKLAVFVCLVAIAVAPTITTGQETKTTLASTMKIYVFPKEGQEGPQQSKDEAACYSWAVQNTGTDPFELAKKAEQQQAQSEQQKAQAEQAGAGAGAAGAVKGAAVGALIGEIVDDDAGGGAAWGAAAGLVAGRSRRRGARQQASQKADQQAQQTAQSTAEQMDGFKKAFSVCLEAKDYLVKY